MELIIRKYSNLNDVKQQLKKTDGDILLDLVYALEVGFVEKSIEKKFIHSHNFCFHYCIDKYQNDINVTFMILDTNKQTGQYCFWGYEHYPYKENIKAKRIPIENTTIKIPIDKNIINYENLYFNDIIQLLKQDLISEHEKSIDFFKTNNISIDSYMNIFEKELKEYIDISYNDLFTEDLSSKIRQYEAHILEKNLPKKNTSKNKIKI